jgi:glycosyltransferase involved in cell wall biosynthesis
MTRIDVVTAVRNEEASIPPFVERVRALRLPQDVELGLLFVEDSSDDGTVPLLRQLASQDPTIRYWSLERGFGQCPAIVYGMAHSAADAIVMLDVDGSHPIDAIPEMIERFRDGARVVQCRRRSIGERSRWRIVGSALFARLGRWLTGIDVALQTTYFRIVSAETAKMLVENSIYWRFLRFPLPDPDSGDLAVLEVDAPERSIGESKYDFFRLTRLAIDGLLSLMPPRRFAASVAFTGLATAAVLALGLWPLAVLLLVGLAWVGWRYAALRAGYGLEHMSCTESSDALAEAH